MSSRVVSPSLEHPTENFFESPRRVLLSIIKNSSFGRNTQHSCHHYIVTLKGWKTWQVKISSDQEKWHKKFKFCFVFFVWII